METAQDSPRMAARLSFQTHPHLSNVHTFESRDLDEDLDPRIQTELEKLNGASEDINKLEMELDDARAVFRQVLSDSTLCLNSLLKKLGSCVDKSRPYYEAKARLKEAHLESQKAVLRFEKSRSLHEAARELVQLAERGYKSREQDLDPAWQEMLNHATKKVNDAEKERMESEEFHKKITTIFQQRENEVHKLERDLRKVIAKSRPYFDMKAKFNNLMEIKKTTVQRLEEEVSSAKALYSQALRSLEAISNGIHQQRLRHTLQLGVRESGVGAEAPSPPPSWSKAEMIIEGCASPALVDSDPEEGPLKIITSGMLSGVSKQKSDRCVYYETLKTSHNVLGAVLDAKDTHRDSHNVLGAVLDAKDTNRDSHNELVATAPPFFSNVTGRAGPDCHEGSSSPANKDNSNVRNHSKLHQKCPEAKKSSSTSDPAPPGHLRIDASESSQSLAGKIATISLTHSESLLSTSCQSSQSGYSQVTHTSLNSEHRPEVSTDARLQTPVYDSESAASVRLPSIVGQNKNDSICKPQSLGSQPLLSQPCVQAAYSARNMPPVSVRRASETDVVRKSYQPQCGQSAVSDPSIVKPLEDILGPCPGSLERLERAPKLRGVILKIDAGASQLNPHSTNPASPQSTYDAPRLNPPAVISTRHPVFSAFLKKH